MPRLDDVDPALGGVPSTPKAPVGGSPAVPSLVTSGAIDPGLAQALGLGSMGGGPVSDIPTLLQETLLSATGEWATASLTTDKFHFRNEILLPDWIRHADPDHKKQLIDAVKKSQLDPFLPKAGGSMSGFDPSWQVYVGRGKDFGFDNERHFEDAEGNKLQLDGPEKDMAEFKTEKDVARGKNKVLQSDNTETAQAVMNAPFLWSDEKIKDAMGRMQKAGLKVDDFGSMVQAWGDMVQVASMRYSLSHGKIKTTPWDVLDLYGSISKDFGGGGSGSGGYSGTVKSTSRSVSDITEGDAWSALRNTLSQMLGRDPSHDEVRKFAYRMNGIAAKNPTVTTTTGTYEDGHLVNQSSHTTGGFNANDIQQEAYEKAQNDPDYAEYQSATTYFNAALSALGSIGNVTN